MKLEIKDKYVESFRTLLEEVIENACGCGEITVKEKRVACLLLDQIEDSIGDKPEPKPVTREKKDLSW